MKNDTTVIVPIRKGSNRVKGKNLRPFYDLEKKPGGAHSFTGSSNNYCKYFPRGT